MLAAAQLSPTSREKETNTMGKTIKREEKLEIRVGIDNPEEREGITKQHTSTLDEIDALRKEAKQAMAAYRKQINEKVKEEVDLRVTLQQGKPELRDVLAHYNFSAGRVKFADKETGKFYKDKEREITDEDRQLTIHDEEGVEEADEATTEQAPAA